MRTNYNFKDVKIVPVHPSMVATNLHHASTCFFLKPFLYTAVVLFATPVAKGALSQIWAAVSPDARSGKHYGPVGKEEPRSKLSQDRELQGGCSSGFRVNSRDMLTR